MDHLTTHFGHLHVLLILGGLVALGVIVISVIELWRNDESEY